MIVMKFGGTSVSSTDNVARIAEVIRKQTKPHVVIVSAFSGVTNLLESIDLNSRYAIGDTLASITDAHAKMIEQLIPDNEQKDCLELVKQELEVLKIIIDSATLLGEVSEKTKARIMATGESLSSKILHRHFCSKGIDIELLDSRELIRANHRHVGATVNKSKTFAAIKSKVNAGSYLSAGFVGSNDFGEIVMLGRGGSDETAAWFAGALNAEELQIWSDVNGLQSANPNFVTATKSLDHLTYDETVEMAFFGAKVLYPPSILPAMESNIPIRLKNTFQPEFEGTLIDFNGSKDAQHVIGISSVGNMAMLNVQGVGLQSDLNLTYRLFKALANVQVKPTVIVQGSSSQSLCIAIAKNDVVKAKQTLNLEFANEINAHHIDPITSDENLAVVALVGESMKSTVGLCSRATLALAQNGINIRSIAQGASERNISITVNKDEEHKAVNVLHEEFFAQAVKRVHLFIAGLGTVGSEFVKLVDNRKTWVHQNLGIELIVAGVARSTGYQINTEGINPSDLQNLELTAAASTSFADAIASLNILNSVFIDVTASSEVANLYEQLLSNSISVVACNKIASSGPLATYRKLKQLSYNKLVHFRYETCVGAALPVMKSINELMINGDIIRSVKAVLSGSLNYIFNSYDGSESFSSVVRKALELGLTEPHPAIDLGGTDVCRKILIIARESGFMRELSDVTVNSFLPDSIDANASVEEFFGQLETNESYFKALFDGASRNGKKLKVIASLENDRLEVNLEEVEPGSPFFKIEGKDNIVVINSNRYNEQPLIIQGAGAGPEITASGVFSDLVQIIKS